MQELSSFAIVHFSFYYPTRLILGGDRFVKQKFISEFYENRSGNLADSHMDKPLQLVPL